MMKIDCSGLDPAMPVKANADDLDNEILAAPSFKLPVTVDVSFILLCFPFLLFWLIVSSQSLPQLIFLFFICFPSV